MQSQGGQEHQVNPYEEIAKNAHGKSGGIDPDLLPYLVEADRQERIDLPISDNLSDQQDSERLRAALQAGGIVLPEEIADPEAVEAKENAENGRDSSAPETAPDSPTSDESLQADFEVAQIYARILSRRPEHNISPTKARIERALDYLSDPQLSYPCLLYTSPSPRDSTSSRMPSSA